MEKEIININPKLGKKHREEFFIFARNLRRKTMNRSIEDRSKFLVAQKELVNKTYSGKTFHANTDLAFMENLVIDLMLQDWEIIIQKNEIRLELDVLDDHEKNMDEEKAKTRRKHLLARDVQLNEPTVREFVKSMEKRRLTVKGWHSIFSVMRDGAELSNLLRQASLIENPAEKIGYLQEAVKPYIEIVEAEKRCQQTGLLLSEIWRYFRHTWINEYKSLPGRSISVLIRDAAIPNHPVIGIAALGSSVAQQTCRDKWIGWDGDTFSSRVRNEPNDKTSRWLMSTLAGLMKEVFIRDFVKSRVITRKEINKPTKEIITRLRDKAAVFKARHIKNPEKSKFSATNQDLSWKERAESDLFKSKRAILLAELLSIKMIFHKHNFIKSTKKDLRRCIEIKEFRDAVEKLVRKAKSIHVGINMMDIIVCGSVAPYNHLLGGKLVCMLLTSPELNQYYNSKYRDYVSLIASSMSGKPIVRKPQLVMLGTTSLYGIGSSQYNRIKIPANELDGLQDQAIDYKELGYSIGFGSFHFSADTISLADAVVGREKGRSRVNSIFGEGANPLIRKLKDAFEYLQLESNPILNHRNKRVVYGIALAENFGDVLLGIASKPRYIISQHKPKEKTELIAKYWIKRWLSNRISNPHVLQKVSEHTLSYPIIHGARVPIVEQRNELTLFD